MPEEQSKTLSEVEGKKQENKESAPIKQGAKVTAAKIGEGDVHVMPKKFLPQQTKKKSSAKTKVILIAVVLIVFLATLIGVGLWFISQNTNVDEIPNENVVVDNNTNTNDNSNDNTNDNTNTNTNDNTNVNTNTNSNDNTNTNTNDNSNDNTNDNTQPSNLDADNDGLTTEEEFAFKTNANQDDTDRDGFTDGAELVNLYSPLAPDTALEDSNLIFKYVNNTFGFSVFRPKVWVSRTLDVENSQIVFLPDSESGEFVSLKVVENTEGFTLIEYNTILNPDETYENFTLGGLSALKKSDGTQAVAIVNDYFFIITYEVTDLDSLNYATTFEMILNSVKFGVEE